MHPHGHQIVRGHLFRCREHRDEQVVLSSFERTLVRRAAPAVATSSVALTAPSLSSWPRRIRGVTVGIDPLLPLPVGLPLQVGRRGVLEAPASSVIRTPSLRPRNSLVTSAGPCPSRSRSSATTGSESSAASRVVSRTSANVYSQASSTSLSSARSSSHPASSPAARSSPSPFHELGFFGQPEEDRVTPAVCTVVCRTSSARARRSARSADRLAWAASSASCRQTDRREHRREVGNQSSRSMSSQGRLVVKAAHVVLVQVRAIEHPAVPEVQDERILVRHGSPA